MDRKGKQKIGFVCFSLSSVILLVILLTGNLYHQRRLFEEQKEELSVLYPEISNSLSENISYYAKQSMQMNIWQMFLIILLVLITWIGICLFCLWNRMRRQMEREKERSYLYEQLLRLQSGQEEILPLPEEIDTGQFNLLYDKLKELGYYFSDLKKCLSEEENSTKTLITDISHQLKTPLASIKMSHELSLSKELSKEERQSFMETETQEILKMEALLDELVKLSRLENSMIQIHPQKCSIKTTIRKAVSLIYIKANAKDIDISVEMEQDIVTLHDHKWTVEALVNILENAVKYSSAKTNITILVSCLVNHVLIQVEDEGIGIPEREMHEIFKRFYRGSNAKDTVKEGAGVGLYLARSIIEQQGGTIVAKRKNGAGTIFCLTLPISDEYKTLTKL